MRLLSSAEPTPNADDIGGGLDDLRNSLLQGLCIACIGVSWIWLAIAAITYERALGPVILIAPFLLFCCSLASLVIDDPTGSRQLVRRGIFVVGIALALAPVFPGRSGEAQWYLGSLAITATGAVFGPIAAALLSICYSVILIFPGSALPLQDIVVRAPALVILWGTALISWLASRSLYTALYWAMHSQQQAWIAANEARSRREELRRTVSSLRATHENLERTVRELGVARRQADEAQRLRSEFAANISHELRTPLNIILGFSEIMTRSPEVYGELTWPRMLHRDLFEIRRNALYLSGFVDDILDLARLDALRMPMHRELSSLGMVIEEAAAIVSQLLRDTSVKLRIDLPDDLPELYIDQTRIRQVMVNLLSNACRFTEQGEITVTARQIVEYVQVSVSDTGTGIAADRLEVIFNQFEQAGAWRRSETAGKGLGLAIARQLVELHGGLIWAESEIGLGSTFHFTLPLSLVHVGQLSKLVSQEGSMAALPTLVLLDADETMSRYLGRRLETIKVIRAADETEARALVSQTHPSAVLASSKSTDCRECQAHVSNIGMDVPIIRCTLPNRAWRQDDDRFVASIIKPVSSGELVDAVQKAAVGGQILVVDDDRGFVQFVERSLQGAQVPFSVVPAYSGQEALDHLHQRVPNVVLMDLILPDMSGIDIVNAMKQDPALSRIPAILVTGASLEEENLQTDHACFCLSRPGHLGGDELVRLIETSMGCLRPSYASVPDAEPTPAADQFG